MRDQDQQQQAGTPAREGAERGSGEGAASALARLRSQERAKAQKHGKRPSATAPRSAPSAAATPPDDAVEG